MNVNITLLTMMTWAARTSGFVEEGADPSEVDIGANPKEWARRRCK